MKTFIQWLESNNVNNEGFFTNLARRFSGDKMPEMTDEQKDTYDKLRNTGMGHEEALRIVIGQQPVHRPVSQSRLDYERDMDAAFERGGTRFAR